MPTYPGAVHCHHLNFPQQIRLVVDAKLASESSLFDEGQSVILRQTPISGQLQGEQVVGEELPTKRMIYTDTGEDSSFNLKVSYEGWGEWVIEQAEDDTYTLYIKKGMAVQAGDWEEEKIFRNGIKLKTQVPTTKDLAGVEPPTTMSFNIQDYVEPEDDASGGDDGGGDTGGTDGSDSGGEVNVTSESVEPVYGPNGQITGYMKITRYSDGSVDREFTSAESTGLSMG